MQMQPKNGNGHAHTPIPVEAEAKAEKQAPVKSWLSSVPGTWKAVVLIVAIAGGGYLAGTKLATAESVKKAQSRIGDAEKRDDGQDRAIRALIDSARWQNQALWDVSHGRELETPPPAIPGVE